MTDKTIDDALTVTVALGLDTKIGENVEYDEDGDVYAKGAITLGDIIAKQAARDLAGFYRQQVEQSPDWNFKPVQVAQDAIDEAVKALVQQTLDRMVQPTDEFGDKKGEPRTIAEILSERVEAWLTGQAKPRDSYSRSSQTNMEKMIDEAVSHEAAAAITKATKEARDQVLGQLQGQQRARLEEAVKFILDSRKL